MATIATALFKCKKRDNPSDLEWCPDEGDRQVLQDGRTKAVVYPNEGFNCKNTNYSNTHLPTPVRNLTPSLSKQMWA
jgi:hypothetical protein